MANSPQAIKRVRQNEKARAHNGHQMSRFRTMLKKVRAMIASQDVSGAQAGLKDFTSYVDTLAKKGLVHKNRASRLKSRLSSAIKAI